MSTRGRGLSRRGRRKRGRTQLDGRHGSTSDGVPLTHVPTPLVGEEQSITQGNELEHEEQSSEGQNSLHTRARGETQGSHAPNNCDSRTLIQPYHNGFIQWQAPRQALTTLRQYMGPWPTWELVPQDRKEFLFGKFREYYTWLPEHEAHIRHSWDHTHKKNYRNIIYRYKLAAIQKAGVDEPGDIEKVVPTNMNSNDWEAICRGHMSDPNYKKKCKKAKQNRLTEKDGSITKHTGGSIPFAEHGRRMVKDGGVVSQVELHERTHRKGKGKGDYVDNKSKRVYDEYEQYKQEYLSQQESDPTQESLFDEKKWLEIVGGSSKGRVYGYGNTYHSRELISSGTSTGSLSTAATSTYVNQEQLQEMISKAREEMAKEREEMAKEREVASARSTSILEEALKARDEAKRLAEETKAREEAIKKTYEAMLAKFSSLEGHGASESAKDK